MSGTVYIAAVNIDARIVVTDSGAVYHIVKFYDCNGDECEPHEASQAVAGCDETWFAFDPNDGFDTVSVH